MRRDSYGPEGQQPQRGRFRQLTRHDLGVNFIVACQLMKRDRQRGGIDAQAHPAVPQAAVGRVPETETEKTAVRPLPQPFLDGIDP